MPCIQTMHCYQYYDQRLPCVLSARVGLYQLGPTLLRFALYEVWLFESSAHIILKETPFDTFCFFRLFSPRVATSDIPYQCGPTSASSSVTSTTAMSSVSFSAFPVSSFLAAPSPAYFSQYTNHLSSVHILYHISLASCFLSKPSHMRCPSDVLMSDIVHSCHS